MAKKPKRSPGRPRIDPTGRQRPISVRLTPAQVRYLAANYPTIGAGIRLLIDRERTKGNP